MIEPLLSIALSPYPYAILAGVLCGMYAVWFMARQQYLDVNKLFNVFSLTIITGYLVALVVQFIDNRLWQHSIGFSDFWVHPRSLVVLFAYLLMALAATRYITAIRYPYWKVMDMLAIGLAALQSWLVIGWLIEQFHWGSIIVATAMALQLACLILLYRKFERPGLTFGAHVFIFFAITLGARYLLLSWQQSMSGVEWISEGLGILFGLILIALRVSVKSEKVLLQDIPRGVSQSFRETFTRTFKYRQLSEVQDSSSHK